jgi:opacity protein-like surface antigen
LTRYAALVRILLFSLFLSCAPSATANADFLFTPFLGSTFGGDTTLLDLDVGAASAKHWTFGGSAAWLSDQIFGVEADFAMTPGFFENSTGTGLVVSSRVTTFTGNVIAAFPLSVTRESLRPYVTGGLGLMRASAEDLIGLNEGGNWIGLQLGAGAIGFINDRTGVRFDLRNSRSLSRDATLLGERKSKLSFWRVTVGVTIRY